MKLKPAILSVLGRDDLKGIVDDLEMDGVDRRSVDAMRAALRRARRATPEILLGHLRKGEIQSVCELLGVPAKGKKDELIGRLISGGHDKPTNRVTKRSNGMANDVKSDNGTSPKPKKKAEKLTLAKLESLLLRACDILRGNMDASEYKEYVFGMLFLKRMSDQFEKDRAALQATYERKGMKAHLVEQQLANPDKYDFYVPLKARWRATDDKGRNMGIAHLKQAVGSGLNKSLAAIEDANPDTLQDVLKTINSTARSASEPWTTIRWSISSSTSTPSH